jgi:hypothetical protein
VAGLGFWWEVLVAGGEGGEKGCACTPTWSDRTGRRKPSGWSWAWPISYVRARILTRQVVSHVPTFVKISKILEAKHIKSEIQKRNKFQNGFFKSE